MATRDRTACIERNVSLVGSEPAVLWFESVLRLIMKGSDALVFDVYRRVRADRGEIVSPASDHQPVKSWCAIAERAVTEGALTPAEALRLVQYEEGDGG